ncbi:MAG: nucleotidyltransferase [Ferruginibacter sp.]
MNENFVDFIRLLNEHGVKYVLVGGWAVIFEGYSRTTGDMDFFIEREESNAEKIMNVVQQFMGSAIGFVKEDFLKEDNVIMLGRTPFRIDILTTITGVSFNEAFKSSRIYSDGGIDIRCIHINELINNKKATGRLKDLADAEMLEKILKKRNK